MNAMVRVEVLRAACCVAGADGDVTENEFKILKGMADAVGVGVVSLEAMIELAKTDKEFVSQQFRVLKSDPPQTLKLLLQIAIADRRLERAECRVIQKLAVQLGISKEQFEQWLREQVDAMKKSS